MVNIRSSVLRTVCLIAVQAMICFAGAEEINRQIPERAITALGEELKQGHAGSKSVVDIRRSCKSVIRQAETILEAAPGAPNRFDLIVVLFQAQQRLVTLEATDDNRNALFRTCERLAEAPDDYAESRLEADFLLSERDLADAEALVADRVKALKDIMDKYRGTSAELRSLTIAALIASKLQAFDLHAEIHNVLSSSALGGDHKAIAFRRRSYSVSSINARFSGTYESTDGSSVTFPIDRLGHQYLVMFWSLNSEGLEGHELFLARIREQQERFPDRFEVYSFNLDGLPDAGRSILTRAGVKATALLLPEGMASSVYSAYALTDPIAIFVNAQGHVELSAGQDVPWPRPGPAHGTVPANPGPGLGLWLDDGRYVAQLRSLFIGDFLVTASDGMEHGPSGRATGSLVLREVLQEIQASFTIPPFRYRLSSQESLANYRKAEKLCAAAIDKYSDFSDVWRVRNLRIIALLGMWNLSVEHKYLEEAEKEAMAVLGVELPAGKDVAARFCLAKGALRRQDSAVDSILAEFVEATGGEKVPATALAAAAILSIEANAEDLYRDYRRRFLDCCNENDPSLWAVSSFLLDRHHDYRLFWPNPGRWGYSREQRYKVRQLIAGFGGPSMPERVMSAMFKDLDGRELKLSEAAKENMVGVVFVELSEDDFVRSACLQRLKKFTSEFSKRDVPVIAAFLSDDINVVRAALKECGGVFRAGMVPDGLRNPLVRQLGILSSDRIPNPYLVYGDGRIVWSGSALTYAVNHTIVDERTAAAVGINIEKVRTDKAFGPLRERDFKKALVMLAERLPPKMAADPWTADRMHGRALAYMGLTDWEAALKEIDAAILQRGTDSRWGMRIYEGNVEMHAVRATILRELGRAGEAEEELAKVERCLAWLEEAPEPEYPPSFARDGIAVGVYDDILRNARLGMAAVEGGK